MKRLAVGGMAELFLAQDSQRSEQVVIKRILPYLSQEAEFVQMFLDEARIAAQLHHPNVITVHELGSLEQSIFLSMEYVEGVDLRKILQQEMKRNAVVPYSIAAYVTAQVCAGLYHAHNTPGIDGRPLDLIHRDVSPQNVMVGYDGRVKLVDFGIAKAGAFMEQSKPGVIKGKFLYLSPEQLSQDKLDRRADLFAVGTMLYEVTTGRSPFHKTTTEAVIYAIRSEEPAPPSQLRPDYPEALSRIVMKCLQKDRTRRYQQASEIERDLEAYLAQVGGTDQHSLSQYVSKLYNVAQERTVLAAATSRPVPRDPRVAERTSPMGPALDAVARRVTTEIKADMGDDDPRTQMAGPEDVARAQALRQPMPTTTKPVRKPTSTAYPSVGGDDATSTDSASSEISDSRATPSTSDSGLAPVVDREGPTRHDRPSDPVFDSMVGPAPERRRPQAPGSRSPSGPRRRREDLRDESTQGSLTDGLGAVWKSPWVLGVGAFVAVALVGVGILWAAQSRTPPPRPPPPEPIRPIVVAVDPPATPPREEAVPDAGPEVSAPENPVVLTPHGDPRPNPVHRHSVLVFNAPAGTRIVRDGKQLVPGHRYTMPVGSVKYEYQCPGKRSLQARTVRAAAGDKPQIVPVPCKGR